MRTGAPADKNRLNQLHWTTIEQTNRLEHLESLNSEDKSMWKTCRALRQKRKPIPVIHGNNGIVYEKRDKAEAFPTHRMTISGATGNSAAPQHQKGTRMGRDRKHCAQKTSETLPC